MLVLLHMMLIPGCSIPAAAAAETLLLHPVLQDIANSHAVVLLHMLFKPGRTIPAAVAAELC
jgi:hypothetical protein